jgi:hypothetical protein
MNARQTMFMLLLVAVTAGLAPSVSAQEGPALPRTDGIQPAAVAEVGGEPGPNQFGSEWSTKVIPVTAFTGKSSSDTYAYTGLGYLRATAGGTFWAPLDLPPGTEVENVCVFMRDASTTGSVLVSWATVRMGDYTQGPGITLQDSVSSGTVDMPGYETICAIPAAPVQIRTYADVDGDGDSETNWHYVGVTVTVDPLVEWSGATVRWRRIMSPAPATATFPNDVPTSHPFFRYVEALYASGITAGCGTGYCPDNPVTRGQMAVFLTKALGLYWPW